MNFSYGIDVHFFGISIINVRICMGFVADILNQIKKLAHLIFYPTVIEDP